MTISIYNASIIEFISKINDISHALLKFME
jgi:hypothetical protein